MKNPDDPRLRVRLYIGGKLADETWIDVTDPQAENIAKGTSRLHAFAIRVAEKFGQ